MPPPQPLLATRIQGFVCRSYLSKLRESRTRRPTWRLQSIASDNGPRRIKEPKVKKKSHERPENGSEPVIRIFNQTADGVRTERGTEPGDEAILDSLQSTVQDVKEELGAKGEEVDEEELQDRVIGRHMQSFVERGGLEDALVEDLEARFEELDTEMEKKIKNVDLESMSEEEKSKFREDLFQQLLVKDKPHGPSFDAAQPEFAPFSQESRREVQQQISILIEALRSAATILDKGLLNKRVSYEIWSAYERYRESLMSNTDLVPGEVWETLWALYTHPNSLYHKYLYRLGRDMTSAGVPMQDWQRLFYIQAMFEEQVYWAAIEEWEGCETTLGRDSDNSADYWRLGVRMYSRNGQFDKALAAADGLIKLTKEASDYRVFIPIVQAFLNSEEKGNKQKAWVLYIRIKTRLGPRMVMEDYDSLASMFFGADLPDLALAVFRDMMLTGDKSARQHDSTALYGNHPGIESDLELMNIGESELASDDIRVLSRLPAKFNNKFFFGKWIKKLIGEGQLDASLKVFKLMHERGIVPDARYVNGVIGAWLRTGVASNHKLAEDTAWRMIQERLDYAEKREKRPVLSYPLRPVCWKDRPGMRPSFRHPMATIETFSVLIEDYRRRQKHDRMRDLLKALEQARIRPNTYFMNQMMMMNTTEVPQYFAWETYTSLTRSQGVRPDFDTFGFLWHLTKKAVDPNLNPKQYPKVVEDVQNTAVPRLMFAEMVKWARKSNPKEELPRELYDEIILSFSLAQDQAGTAIALRALQRYFKILPNEDTVRTIVLQLARTGLENRDSNPRRRRRIPVMKSPAVKERVMQVTKLLEGLKARRVDELSQKGVVFEELKEKERLEESLILMINLLRYVTEVRLEEGQDVAEIFESAGRDMGAPDCIP